MECVSPPISECRGVVRIFAHEVAREGGTEESKIVGANAGSKQAHSKWQV